MGKPTICICENKDADQLRGDQRLCFRYTDNLQFLSFLNPNFPASNHLLWLYSPVCVGPGRNPHCWFSHAQAHIGFLQIGLQVQSKSFRDVLVSFSVCIQRPWVQSKVTKAFRTLIPIFPSPSTIPI